MSSGGWKGIVKNGWHPEKEGSSMKGQLKGLVGRGDGSPARNEHHVAAPISTLRDPASFGPPPTRHAGVSSGSPSGATPPPYSPTSSSSYAPTPTHSAGQRPQISPPVEDISPKRGPYRVDTTGLSTAHLPPPPTRRDGADGRVLPQPPPKSLASAPKVAPSLPPRLPPRGAGSVPSDPGSDSSNRGAVHRLGAAGISVPGLGIDTDKAPAHSLVGSPSRLGEHGRSTELQPTVTSTAGKMSPALGKKKPPPPPVAKKTHSLGSSAESTTPPPVPLATRPR